MAIKCDYTKNIECKNSGLFEICKIELLKSTILRETLFV